MAFSSMLFMKAVTQGLSALAGSLALWRQLFPPAVPTALVDGWFGVFQTGGVCNVKVIPAYKTGLHRPPVVIVRAGSIEDDGTAMGYDSPTDDLDGEVDSFAVLRERQSMALTIIAPTVEMQAAIHAAVQACVLDNIRSGFFEAQGLRGITPSGSGEIDPNEEVPQELLGTYMSQSLWSLREDTEYPRLIPNTDVVGDLGIAFRDATDHLGSPGRVTVNDDPPTVVGQWPIANSIDVNAGTLIEARFSRCMDSTTTLASISVTIDATPAPAEELTITLVDDPPTNVGALRDNRLRVKRAGGWGAAAQIAATIAVTALSDTGVAMEEAVAWTFVTAG